MRPDKNRLFGTSEHKTISSSTIFVIALAVILVGGPVGLGLVVLCGIAFAAAKMADVDLGFDISGPKPKARSKSQIKAPEKPELAELIRRLTPKPIPRDEDAYRPSQSVQTPEYGTYEIGLSREKQLEQLRVLRDAGLYTPEEYRAKKAQIQQGD